MGIGTVMAKPLYTTGGSLTINGVTRSIPQGRGPIFLTPVVDAASYAYEAWDAQAAADAVSQMAETGPAVVMLEGSGFNDDIVMENKDVIKNIEGFYSYNTNLSENIVRQLNPDNLKEFSFSAKPGFESKTNDMIGIISSDFPGLISLSLNGIKNVDGDSFLNNNLSLLQRLNLNASRIDNKALKNLTNVKQLQYLEVSSFDYSTVDEVLNQFPNLIMLDVSNSNIQKYNIVQEKHYISAEIINAGKTFEEHFMKWVGDPNADLSKLEILKVKDLILSKEFIKALFEKLPSLQRISYDIGTVIYRADIANP